MAYAAKVVLDSISQAGNRLMTLEVTFPRMVLAEFNTHRVLSRNSASSRAIPVEKQLMRLEDNPFIPIYWGKNQAGMQASVELSLGDQQKATAIWLQARDDATKHARDLLDLGVHKQIANRLLEPFMWHTVIVTATEWDNFFALRDHTDAQPEIHKIAEMMREVIWESSPTLIERGQWHLPYIQEDELEWARANPKEAIMVSSGRCARVSYLTHDGQRDFSKDIELYERLVQGGHMSPTEHPATPHFRVNSQEGRWSGNFFGWKQHRKYLPNEDNFMRILEARTA